MKWEKHALGRSHVGCCRKPFGELLGGCWKGLSSGLGVAIGPDGWTLQRGRRQTLQGMQCEEIVKMRSPVSPECWGAARNVLDTCGQQEMSRPARGALEHWELGARGAALRCIDRCVRWSSPVRDYGLMPRWFMVERNRGGLGGLGTCRGTDARRKQPWPCAESCLARVRAGRNSRDELHVTGSILPFQPLAVPALHRTFASPPQACLPWKEGVAGSKAHLAMACCEDDNTCRWGVLPSSLPLLRSSTLHVHGHRKLPPGAHHLRGTHSLTVQPRAKPFIPSAESTNWLPPARFQIVAQLPSARDRDVLASETSPDHGAAP
ncbi:uncharacterized protein BDR25DRAFT_310235 [Lindgomyces ingoldianus]|uniref:Uncharacterized protein n=1 Tax=Lindgomyces ingoldianus TaxID=673940 RepID=A0ACB6RB49_9PLEO|nr:uncharacterized protein BDR25DRAFT_310235 [Lindgomyces ingoldianus]KAF2475752.1 hypothetical protein BDR25DRAFT_310235 [Lindgomyces ingoldianus]